VRTSSPEGGVLTTEVNGKKKGYKHWGKDLPRFCSWFNAEVEVFVNEGNKRKDVYKGTIGSGPIGDLRW